MSKLPCCLSLAVLAGYALSTAAEAPALPDLTGLHVALDVGHSRAQGGAISARGRSEFEFNLETAKSIAGVLRAAGAKVSVINEKGGITGLVERPLAAARLGADAFLSIHHDSVNDKYLKTWEFGGKIRSYSDAFRGYSVFCSKKNAKAVQSRELALAIGAAMLESEFKPTLHHNEPIPGENRPLIDKRTGVYEYTNLAVARYGPLPSVLLECGVIVHRQEELEVQSPEFRQRLGEAVARGVATARAKGVLGPGSPAKAPKTLLKLR